MLNHNGTQTIETERLILRKFAFADAEDMLKYWISDPSVQFLYAEPIYINHQELAEPLGKYISSYEKSDYYRWAVISKETNECIGQVAFFLVDSENHFGEIEYCIGRTFQKKGFATEATKAVMKFGFETINFHKIQICHREGNTASQKVIEKCGLKYEGTLRDFFYRDGDYFGRLYYSTLKEEWSKKEHNLSSS